MDASLGAAVGFLSTHTGEIAFITIDIGANYEDLQRIGDGSSPPQSVSGTAQYAELCALYSLWGIVPLQRGTPLFCSELDRVTLQETAKLETLDFRDFIRLPSYELLLRSTHHPYDEQIYTQDARFEAILTAALLDYAAATYGHAQIRALWPILHEHNDWGTLIPAVFGVSTAEFEAGWQTYLADMSAD